jgi:serine/threonine protein kinase
MELVSGGELFDQIVRNKCLNEIEAKFVFRQLLEGIAYMHSRNVIHRDLKPENILVSSSRDISPPDTGKLREVKIADFGLSKVVTDGASYAKTFVGTPQYWAPEVLDVQRGGGSYTQAADFWSLGAVLFVMLSGKYPFDGKKMPLDQQIQTAAYNMNTSAWQRVSDVAKDIVRGLLRVNPAERFGLEACLRHPWVIGTGSFSPQLPPVSFGPGPQTTEDDPLPRSTTSRGGPFAVINDASNTSDVSASVRANSGGSDTHPTGAGGAGTSGRSSPAAPASPSTEASAKPLEVPSMEVPGLVVV